MPCYQALKGFSAPCSDCPLLQITANSGSQINCDHELGCYILTETSKVNWQGCDACMVSRRTIPAMNISEKVEITTDFQEMKR